MIRRSQPAGSPLTVILEGYAVTTPGRVNSHNAHRVRALALSRARRRPGLDTELDVTGDTTSTPDSTPARTARPDTSSRVVGE